MFDMQKDVKRLDATKMQSVKEYQAKLAKILGHDWYVNFKE